MIFWLLVLAATGALMGWAARGLWDCELVDEDVLILLARETGELRDDLACEALDRDRRSVEAMRRYAALEGVEVALRRRAARGRRCS
jgi:hypothetical protein